MSLKPIYFLIIVLSFINVIYSGSPLGRNPFSLKINVEKYIKKAKKLSSLSNLKEKLALEDETKLTDEFLDEYLTDFVKLAAELDDFFESSVLVDRNIEAKEIDKYFEKKKDFFDMHQEIFGDFDKFVEKSKNNKYGEWVLDKFFYHDRANLKKFDLVFGGTTKNKKNNENYDVFFLMAKGDFTRKQDEDDKKEKKPTKLIDSPTQRKMIKSWLNILIIKAFKELFEIEKKNENSDL